MKRRNQLPPLEQLKDADGKPLVADDGTPLHVMVVTPAGSGPWPTVPVIHGGHWVVGDPYVGIVRDDLVAAGFAIFYPEYRLAPPGSIAGQTTLGQYPDQTNDVEAQMLAIARDPRCQSLVGVIGGSAGGYFACWLAAKKLVPCAVALSPATQLNDLGIAQAQADNYAPGHLLEASPNTYLAPDSSDIMFVAYAKDQMPDSQRLDYIQAQTVIGVAPRVTLLAGRGHSFNAWPTVKAAAINFINDHR